MSKGNNKQEEPRYVGGQALIEGVMMRGASKYSLAIRKEDGSIKVIDNKLDSYMEKNPLYKKPFIRGVIALFENMVIGTRALLISANEALPAEEESKSKSTEMNWALYLTVIVSFILGFGFFVALPMLVVEILMGIKSGGEMGEVITYNIVSGVLRIFLFVGYVYAISLIKDIRRLFQYHGAEHVAVNAYEAGEEMTVENVKKYPTYHPRCGTSFMFFVLLIAILIFSLMNALFLWLGWIPVAFDGESIWNKLHRQLILIPSHILVLPLIGSVSYELIKLSFKKQNNIFVRMLAYPGYLIQKITTRPPDDDQLEVSIAALKAAVADIEQTEANKAIQDQTQESLPSERTITA